MVDTQTDRCVRWIKEGIWIRKMAPTKNRDEGGYKLSHICPQRHLVSSEDTVPDEAYRWCLKR